MAQVAWNQIGGNITRFNPALHKFLHHAHQQLDAQSAAILGAMLGRQAHMRAYLDAFLVLGLSVLVTLPLLLFMKDIKKCPRPQAEEGVSSSLSAHGEG